jgi:hypothetical protein
MTWFRNLVRFMWSCRTLDRRIKKGGKHVVTLLQGWWCGRPANSHSFVVRWFSMPSHSLTTQF